MEPRVALFQDGTYRLSPRTLTDLGERFTVEVFSSLVGLMQACQGADWNLFVVDVASPERQAPAIVEAISRGHRGTQPAPIVFLGASASPVPGMDFISDGELPSLIDLLAQKVRPNAPDRGKSQVKPGGSGRSLELAHRRLAHRFYMRCAERAEDALSLLTGLIATGPQRARRAEELSDLLNLMKGEATLLGDAPLVSVLHLAEDLAARIGGSAASQPLATPRALEELFMDLKRMATGDLRPRELAAELHCMRLRSACIELTSRSLPAVR